MSATTTQEPSAAFLALRRSPLPALRRLALLETETTVVINGSVSSYYLKQLAQETVLPALQGRQLQNKVVVVHRPTVPNA
jgi:hypothetical protein